MKLFAAAVYLALGVLISGRSAAWIEDHCAPPNKTTIADAALVVVAWGVLIPATVVYGLSRKDRESSCK